jgi:predicted metal-dependent hydrolase
MMKLPFAYSIRRSARVKRMRIVVSHNKIEVVAPPKTAEKWLHQFVRDKQEWILQATRKVAGKQPPDLPMPVVYGEGTVIRYQGQQYPLTLVASQLKRVKISFNGAFVAYMPDSLPAGQDSAAIKSALVVWLKQQARLQVGQLVARHAPKKQRVPRSIIIKTQKSRWGSCGIHDDININVLLMMAPPDVLEYVVVHELCHLHVRNHSGQFWSLVSEHLPDYQQQRLWLKQQGGELMRYGMAMLAK